MKGFGYNFKRTINENPFIASECSKKGWISESQDSFKLFVVFVREDNVELEEKKLEFLIFER